MKLRRLNMDNSWQLEFSGLKILVDPWLVGAEIDFFPWFNKQWHKTLPVKITEIGSYDLVLITQKYPDHFHAVTLELLQPRKVICPNSILNKVKKLLPNCQVQDFNKGIKQVLNSDLNIHFLPSHRKIDPIYDALLLEDGNESIFIASHGFPDIEKHRDSIKEKPAIKLLLSPFDHYVLPFFLGGTVAPGISGLKHLVDVLQARFVVATHDEDKHTKGLVSFFAKIIKAPKQEDLEKDLILQNKILSIHDYNVHEL